MSESKFYIAQYGCAIYGIGETEEQARVDARENGLQFNDLEVNHVSGSALCGDKKNYKLVTAEGNELTYGMIICMSEQDKNLYWKW